jgi:hypothetical protein
MPVSRRALLAAAGGAGAAGIAAVLATRDSSHAPARAPRAPAAAVSKGATSRTTDLFGLGDVGIANFLLTLQRAEQDLYRRALASGTLSGRARSAFEGFSAQEDEHVARLERTIAQLGTHTVRRPRTSLPLNSAPAFIQFAGTLENVVASACLGQLTAIDTRLLKDAVLAIQSVDARHASAFALLAGLDPAPDGALAQPVDAATALTKLRPILQP